MVLLHILLLLVRVASAVGIFFALLLAAARWDEQRESRRQFIASTTEDAESRNRAAIELYATKARIDTAWIQTEIRRESTRIRRLMAEELNDRP